MPKISVITPDKAAEAALPEGFSSCTSAARYCDGAQFPLALYRHDLAPGARITIGPMETDCAAYIWRGAAEAGGHELPVGSSAIVEKGARLELFVQDGATILTFAATRAGASSGSVKGRAHILPAGLVPRESDLGNGVGGAIHADSDCPGCRVWLHENSFPGAPPPAPEDRQKGVHCHSEDEIIFVTGGAMRLGNRLVGPGTALAIAAYTFYSFTPGPDGLSFINFRADRPGDIRFAAGHAISETGYWRERLPRPAYLEAVL